MYYITLNNIILKGSGVPRWAEVRAPRHCLQVGEQTLGDKRATNHHHRQRHQLQTAQTSNSSSSGSRQAREEPKKGKSSTYNFQDDWHISSCPGSTLKKRTLNGHFPRLAQTDPYVFRNCLVNSRPRPPHHHHHHHYDHFRNRHPYTIMYLGTAWSTPAEQSNSPTLGWHDQCLRATTTDLARKVCLWWEDQSLRVTTIGSARKSLVIVLHNFCLHKFSLKSH